MFETKLGTYLQSNRYSELKNTMCSGRQNMTNRIVNVLIFLGYLNIYINNLFRTEWWKCGKCRCSQDVAWWPHKIQRNRSANRSKVAWSLIYFLSKFQLIIASNSHCILTAVYLLSCAVSFESDDRICNIYFCMLIFSLFSLVFVSPQNASCNFDYNSCDVL